MKNPDEDQAFEQWRQKKLDMQAEPYDQYVQSKAVPQWHAKVGTVIPFSKTVDRDPNPRIPLSVPVDSPKAVEAIAWSIIAAFVGLAYWWVAA